MLFVDIWITLLLYALYAAVYGEPMFWFHKDKNMPCRSQVCLSVTKCYHMWYLLGMTVSCKLCCLYTKVSHVFVILSHYLYLVYLLP